MCKSRREATDRRSWLTSRQCQSYHCEHNEMLHKCTIHLNKLLTLQMVSHSVDSHIIFRNNGVPCLPKFMGGQPWRDLRETGNDPFAICVKTEECVKSKNV